ncbi:hypothetical protein [Terracoccus luteus]|uniref:Lipoprotein LprG n=1 Tax=Terracoccus luteus TaxID=53356 RepID=A0A839PY10_9MICO|nr:hypothetical protein [Terracoccus luteus]MBB2985672.1 hypothetical protein [Terracoccus luteus]MCP2171324.1 hypothetical protein [Terracoccus luteus]
MSSFSTRVVAAVGSAAVAVALTACSGETTPSAGAPSNAVGSASAGTSDPAASATTSTAAPSTAPSSATSTSGSTAGGSSTSAAAQVLEKAKANALAARTVTFKGGVPDGGGRIEITSTGAVDASTADISVSSPKQGKARIIIVPSGNFVQADAAFWKSSGAPASVQKAGSKFVKAPGDATSLARSFSFTSLAEKAFDGLDANDLAPDVTEKTVNGVDCLVVTGPDGEAQGALYVSKDGNQIVRFTERGGTQLDFSGWNAPLTVAAPPASQVITLGG